MQPGFNPSSTPPSGDSHSQRFLIPQTGRVRFVVLFMLLTGIGLLVGLWLFPILGNKTFANYGQVSRILPRFLENIFLGASVGAAQWLILRQYVPSGLWIVATSVGWGISSVIANAWFETMGGALGNIFYIWLGLTQWLVLRKYARNAWWWVFVVCVSFYVSRLVTFLLFLAVSTRILPLRVSSQVLMSIIVGAVTLAPIQAISLCKFRSYPIRS